MSNNVSTYGNTFEGCINNWVGGTMWDGTLTGGGGTTLDWNRLDKDLPLGYAVQIYLNGEPREVIKVFREVPS